MNYNQIPLGQFVAQVLGSSSDPMSGGVGGGPGLYRWDGNTLTSGGFWGIPSTTVDPASVLGMSPQAYFAQPDYANNGFSYNPSSGMVTTPGDQGGDLFGSTIMPLLAGAGVGALSGGFGLGDLFGSLGGGASTVADTSGFLNPEATNLITQTGSNLTGGGSMWDWLDNLNLSDTPTDLGGVGGSGLSQDEMQQLINQANGEIAGGGVSPASGFGGGSATLVNQLQSLLSGGGTGTGSPLGAVKDAASLLHLLGGGGTGGGGSLGSSILGQLSSNPLGAAFNSTPFLLSLYQANKQRNEVQPFIDELSSLGTQFAGNQPAYLKALTDPYDMQQGQARSALEQSIGQRGLRGSSFGDQALNNFDYMSNLGRGDLLSRGITTGLGAQTGFANSAINAINTANLSQNALLGAGLNASGRLFSPQSDPFGLNYLRTLGVA